MSENNNHTSPARSQTPPNASEPSSPTKPQDPINISSSTGKASPTSRSPSVPPPSSVTLESTQGTCQPANGDSVGQTGRHEPLPETQVNDSKKPLEDFDWDDLEERFCKKMEECGKVEKELEEEFAEWIEVRLCSFS